MGELQAGGLGSHQCCTLLLLTQHVPTSRPSSLSSPLPHASLVFHLKVRHHCLSTGPVRNPEDFSLPQHRWQNWTV